MATRCPMHRTPMNDRLHPARPIDSTDCLRLREQLWEGDDHAAEIAQYFDGELDEPVEVLIARAADGTAVGHVELSIRDDIAGLEGQRTGYIEGLYVDDAHRHRRVALQLLRASEAWARQQGCSAFASDRDDRVIVHRRYKGII